VSVKHLHSSLEFLPENEHVIIFLIKIINTQNKGTGPGWVS